MRMIAIGLLMAATLTACGRGNAPPAAPPAIAASTAAEGIAWIEGDVEAAFVQAKTENKLVFLYWGAEWCPPCHDLSAHVFSRHDFQEKIRQFVPVHLDGDLPGAQRLAGEFNVLGYPTAVVLRADRTEVARIAGGMDLTRYADVLDLALESVRPLPEVLAALRTDADVPLSATDCRRIAYNGWRLDPLASGQADALVESLSLAVARCPANAIRERDRLTLTAAAVAAESQRAAVENGTAPTPRLAGLIDAVIALLGQRERAFDNADELLSIGDDFFVVVRHARPAQVASVQADWNALMDGLENDPRYADTERLMSAGGRLMAARALSADGKIPGPIAARARATLDTFLARDYSADARAGIVNSASWVLTYLEDGERLLRLLEGERRTSRTPYYYMPDIADLHENAGRTKEALDWLERGYRESKGPATRFQWGTLYVQGLLRMSPKDTERIRTAALAVLGELDGPDRIHARTRARLGRLGEALHVWSRQGGEAEALSAVTAGWQKICAGLPPADPVRAECPGLLSVAGT